MILSLVSDTGYLVLPDTRSCCARLCTLSDQLMFMPPTIKSNCPVHVLVKTICGVPASAYEAKTAGICIGVHEAVPIIKAQVDLRKVNLTFFGQVANKTMEMTLTNTIHWLIIRLCTRSTITKPAMYITYKCVLISTHIMHARS